MVGVDVGTDLPMHGWLLPAAIKGEALKFVRGWHWDIEAAVEATPLDSITRSRIADRCVVAARCFMPGLFPSPWSPHFGGLSWLPPPALLTQVGLALWWQHWRHHSGRGCAAPHDAQPWPGRWRGPGGCCGLGTAPGSPARPRGGSLGPGRLLQRQQHRRPRGSAHSSPSSFPAV